jgi:hypothetical protein
MARRSLAIITTALLALGFACNSDDDDTSSSTTTTTSPEAEVEAAYLAFADMGARLLQDPDPSDPEIDERTTGQAKEGLVASLQSLSDARLRFEIGPDYSHDVEAVDLNGDDAVLDVCVIDDSKQVDDSGQVTAEGVTTVDWTVEMQRDDDMWLVADITENEVQEGMAECG